MVSSQKPLSEFVLNRLSIGRRFWKAEISELEGEWAEQVRKYASDLSTNIPAGIGLYLFGDNSRGKTHAASAVLKEAQRAGYSAYAILASDLKSAYIDERRFDDAQTMVQRAETVDVLLLDDVGKEYINSKSGWAEQCFETLLRKRTRDLKTTLITTNLTPRDFSERYAKSASSLIYESSIRIHVEGKNYRQVIGQHLYD